MLQHALILLSEKGEIRFSIVPKLIFNNIKIIKKNYVTGINAGNVWNALNEGGKLNVKDLKKATKIKTDRELNLTLGWLLREDKVVVEEEGKEVFVSLK